MTLYRAARRADPAYLPAQVEYFAIMLDQFRGSELRREFPASDTSTSLKACLAAAAQYRADDTRPVQRLRAIEKRFGPTPCTDAYLLAFSDFTPARAARALRESSDIRDIVSAVAGGLASVGKRREADDLLRDRTRTLNDPLAPATFALARMSILNGNRDTAAALAVWRAADADTRRGGPPGARALFLYAKCTGNYSYPGSSPESRAAGCAELRPLVRRARAPFLEWNMTRHEAKGLVDKGELSRATPLLDRSIVLADSVGTPGMRLWAYTARGRARSQLGHHAPALSDLRKAIEVGPLMESPYYFADAYHNLAHIYESAGRFREGAFAADSFAMIADSLPVTPGRYMSRHDAGMIRWAAGWHAAATRDFDAMVRVIDEQRSGHFFAGEYFERVGNLGRAIEYYRVGARVRGGDPRNFTALARLFDALGLPDSAEAAARQHDAVSDRWPVLEQPLLPDILVKHGRTREAIAEAERWARRELNAGNVHGAALAQLRLAELLLLNNATARADAAATSADSLSRILKLTAEGVRARTLRGRALFARGLREAGVADLQAAVRLATAHPSTSALLSTNLALGNALAAFSRPAEALAAFDRAASAVETMTSGLDEDVTRAGFKSMHMAPFDGALRMLAARPASPANTGAALEWSARRKAAAMVLAGNRSGVRTTAVSLSRIRERLRVDEALVDFTTLDTAVLAIVARRESATLIRLEVTASQLRTWIETLRRPLVTTPGGRIDLAHAYFDVAVAESLYRALVRPLAPNLAGATRIAIVPDGALWYLPFPALVASRDGNRPSFLIERFETRLLPSAAFLTAGSTAGSLPRGFRVDAFAHGVTGGAAEVGAIQGGVGAARVTVRNGPLATEGAAMRATAHVLHVAAHGIVNDRDPLASHLRLAPGAGDDGLLHLSEVTAAKIVPSVVVLTACEAVNGKLYAGEGLVGLARAFLVSGARQVIASQWPVDASAVELTRALYVGLARGQDPSAALRSAQLALMNQPATAHPIHWAGFIVFDGGATARK